MTAKMQCGTCNKTINYPISAAGKTAKCPGCGERIRLREISSPTIDAPAIDAPARVPPALPPAVKSAQAKPRAISNAPAASATIAAATKEDQERAEFVAKRVTAGLFALFLFGPLGSHKFYLGQTNAGLIMAGVSLTGIAGSCMLFPLALLVVTSVIACAEAVIYLTKSDEQFWQDYAVKGKQWF